LYDLTKGNYRVFRAITYPEFPASLIVLDVQVKVDRNSEWATSICINGTYDGPTDIISCKNYQIKWTVESTKLLESGVAILEVASGKPLRQIWSSIITPEKQFGKRAFDRFPAEGELISASISPFQIDGNRMSYDWEGTVQRQSRGD
jgi:hypothetical protein